MAAGPRTYWKGQLRLSLVTIAVALFPATTRQSRLELHQVHKPSGKRIRYEKVVPGIGPVDTDEIVKGFEVDKGTYVVLEPDELDEIKVESRRTIELVQFVDHAEIDPRYFNRPYYVAPEGDLAEEGFVVIRDALRDSGKVGLGQMAIRGREHLISIKPCGKGLLLETLRYQDEIVESDAVFDDIPEIDADEEMVDLAEELIERKTKPFDASAFHDSYAEALRELAEKKAEGKAVVHSDESGGKRSAEVIDLMAALKQSVKGSSSSGGGKKSSSRKSSSKSGKSTSKRGSSQGGARRKAS